MWRMLEKKLMKTDFKKKYICKIRKIDVCFCHFSHNLILKVHIYKFQFTHSIVFKSTLNQNINSSILSDYKPTGRKIHNNFGNFSNNSILLKCTMILGTKYIVQYLYVIQLVYSMYFYFCFDLQERESWSKTKIALKCIKEIVVIVEAESFAAACRHQKLYFRGRPDDDFFLQV